MNSVAVPDGLAADYYEALNRIPALVSSAAQKQWSPAFTACALSAAAAKGQHAFAEVVLELTSPEIAGEFLEWFYDR